MQEGVRMHLQASSSSLSCLVAMCSMPSAEANAVTANNQAYAYSGITSHTTPFEGWKR